MPVPVTVTPPDNSIIIPLTAFMAVTIGTSPFSSAVQLTLRSDAAANGWETVVNALGNINATATVPLIGTENAFLPGAIGSFYDTTEIQDWIGGPLFLSSSGDVTGGDGVVLTFILTYQVVNLSGLI